MTYIYPDNLSAKPVLWFWELRDMAVIGIAGIFAAALLTAFSLLFPIALTAAYAFLTMRIGDTSVKEYLFKSCAFFLWGQQYYEWGGEYF